MKNFKYGNYYLCGFYNKAWQGLIEISDTKQQSNVKNVLRLEGYAIYAFMFDKKKFKVGNIL